LTIPPFFTEISYICNRLGPPETGMQSRTHEPDVKPSLKLSNHKTVA